MTTADGQGSTQPADEWEHLAQAAAAATKGPWEIVDVRTVLAADGWPVTRTTHAGGKGLANAEFIAAANPATILRLIAQRDEARAEAERSLDAITELRAANAEIDYLTHQRDETLRLGQQVADALDRQGSVDGFTWLKALNHAMREWREWQEVRK